jgi:RNA polymerase sigma factor (sigma-70 family)
MDRAEFAEAFETGVPVTRRFLLSRGARADEADEIAQAAWVRGWEHRKQLRDPSLVGYWVNSIARNLFRARFRTVQPTPIDGVEPYYVLGVEDDLDLKKMLDRCGPRDRSLLEKSLRGYSAEEIAHSEGISSTGIRVRLLRIRQNIREQLALAS